ncbi:MAG: hypothetical protein LBE20_06465 [Deltaproteobacteria bacterium]|nr:hypothetical protein [Deltaproteobacteria bacterium]
MNKFRVKLFFLVFILSLDNVTFAQEELASSLGAVTLPQVETVQSSISKNKNLVGSNLPPHSELWGSATKGLIYCLGIFLIFLALKHKLNLKNSNNSDNSIRILAKKVIGNRASFLLIEVENKKFLVAHNYDSLHLISEIIDDGYLATNYKE